ncbi:MAG TPA: biotin-dependent carboxyltransferase family protein [Herpetosiphonaceae bacterium]
MRILSGGVLTTVQDHGRHGTRRYGVPQSGALDPIALSLANRLLDNPHDAAALEITAGGAAFEVLAPTLLAITGGDLGALLDDEPLPLWTVVFARPGAEIRFVGRRQSWGARAYLAIEGGLDVPAILGSRSTYLAGGFGGLDGRALRTGDLLATRRVADALPLAGRTCPIAAYPPYSVEPALRLLPGPHLDRFVSGVLDLLLTEPFTINASANRMGYRLDGPPLCYAAPCSLPSLGVLPGVIQVPPDGNPILLMADAQTTGGYPIVGVVIEPDLALAAQLLPGDRLRFRLTTLDEAIAARREVQQWCSSIPTTDIDLLAWAGALE